MYSTTYRISEFEQEQRAISELYPPIEWIEQGWKVSESLDKESYDAILRLSAEELLVLSSWAEQLADLKLVVRRKQQ